MQGDITKEYSLSMRFYQNKLLLKMASVFRLKLMTGAGTIQKRGGPS
jgi:hypothetical protein